jgi:hypothetical protein
MISMSQKRKLLTIKELKRRLIPDLIDVILEYEGQGPVGIFETDVKNTSNCIGVSENGEEVFSIDFNYNCDTVNVKTCEIRRLSLEHVLKEVSYPIIQELDDVMFVASGEYTADRRELTYKKIYGVSSKNGRGLFEIYNLHERVLDFDICFQTKRVYVLFTSFNTGVFSSAGKMLCRFQTPEGYTHIKSDQGELFFTKDLKKFHVYSTRGKFVRSFDIDAYGLSRRSSKFCVGGGECFIVEYRKILVYSSYNGRFLRKFDVVYPHLSYRNVVESIAIRKSKLFVSFSYNSVSVFS